VEVDHRRRRARDQIGVTGDVALGLFELRLVLGELRLGAGELRVGLAVISRSPALTSAPSATETFSTVASKCGRSATLAIACAVPISPTFQGTSLRTAGATCTETGGRGGGASGALATAGAPVSAA